MQKLKARLTRNPGAATDSGDDTPQSAAARGVRAFCEANAGGNAEEEVLHLPAIVDAAESSPAAAREAALQIRRYLSRDYLERSAVQYNAIMLVRILADNPGRTFTRSFDGKFVGIVKELSRQSRDPSVQQILRETLDAFVLEKADDEGLKALLDMWVREREKQQNAVAEGRMSMAPNQRNLPPPPPHAPPSQNYFARNHKPHRLPPPHELAGRIEEAKTSANLLLQVVQSTPASEVLNNDLIAEFAQRCQSASRSVQGYINSDDPTPDDDTLLTLIETNEQLSMAMSRHQRAVLQARKVMGTRPTSASPPSADPGPGADPFADANSTSGPGTSNGFPATSASAAYQYSAPSAPADDLYGVEDHDAPAAPHAPPIPQFHDDPSKLPKRDDSFRLTLPPSNSDNSPAGNDPRWSWSERMSTQAGYGSRSAAQTAENQAAQDSSRPGPPPSHAAQQRQPPTEQSRPSVFSRASSLFHRQNSAVANTTMRGAANGTVTTDGTVSPVSPLDARPSPVTGR